MKKGIKLLAIASFFALSLCSCGNDDTVEHKTGTNTNENTPQVSQVHFTEEPTTEPDVLIEINPFEGWELEGNIIKNDNSFYGLEPTIDGQRVINNFYQSDVYKFLKKHDIEADIDYYTLDGKLCEKIHLPENATLVAKIGMRSTEELKDEGYTDIVETTPEAEGIERLTEEDFLDYCRKRGIVFTEITSPEIVIKVTVDHTID